MRSRILAAALVAAATPLAAGAETCPERADLAQGITLSMTDGSFSMTTTATDVGIDVASTSRFSDGELFTMVSSFAHPLSMPVQTPGADPTQIVYAEPVEELGNLTQLRSWSSEFEFRKDGEVQANGTQTSTLTGFGEITIGTCSYDVWRVNRTIVYSDGFGLYSEHAYSPDLGIILGETTLQQDGSTTAVVYFDKIEAE